MAEKTHSSITLRLETIETLKGLKAHPRSTYDEVVGELMTLAGFMPNAFGAARTAPERDESQSDGGKGGGDSQGVTARPTENGQEEANHSLSSPSPPLSSPSSRDSDASSSCPTCWGDTTISRPCRWCGASYGDCFGRDFTKDAPHGMCCDKCKSHRIDHDPHFDPPTPIAKCPKCFVDMSADDVAEWERGIDLGYSTVGLTRGIPTHFPKCPPITSDSTTPRDESPGRGDPSPKNGPLVESGVASTLTGKEGSNRDVRTLETQDAGLPLTPTDQPEPSASLTCRAPDAYPTSFTPKNICELPADQDCELSFCSDHHGVAHKRGCRTVE